MLVTSDRYVLSYYTTAEEFRKYFDHLLTLSFADTPDYAYLKSLFRDLFRKHRYEYDSVLYDWEVLSATGECML